MKAGSPGGRGLCRGLVASTLAHPLTLHGPRALLLPAEPAVTSPHLSQPHAAWSRAQADQGVSARPSALAECRLTLSPDRDGQQI